MTDKKELLEKIKLLKVKDESDEITEEEKEELVELNKKLDEYKNSTKSELTISEQTLQVITEEFQLKRINEEEKNREEKKEKVLKEIKQSKKEIKKLNRKGKITSASISTALTGILLVPSNYLSDTFILNLLKEIYGPSLDSSRLVISFQLTIALLLFISLYIGSIMWFKISRMEKNVEGFLSTLESEGNQNQLFLNFINEVQLSEKEFSKGDFYEYILFQGDKDFSIKRYNHPRLFVPGIDSHTIQLSVEKVANSIIEDKVNKGFIKESINGYETVYKISNQ